jgi:hypothetical protein
MKGPLNWSRPARIDVIFPPRPILECTFDVRGRILYQEDLYVLLGG